jgi:hypothetical protein
MLYAIGLSNYFFKLQTTLTIKNWLDIKWRIAINHIFSSDWWIFAMYNTNMLTIYVGIWMCPCNYICITMQLQFPLTKIWHMAIQRPCTTWKHVTYLWEKNCVSNKGKWTMCCLLKGNNVITIVITYL